LRIPKLSATIQRRLLISYRVKPAALSFYLPKGLRPQIVDGSAVAGMCLIRLADVRPQFIKPKIGWKGENAAHRIAVEWDTDDGIQTGVFIPERHSNSILPVLAGGRIFPGKHVPAEFIVNETASQFQIKMTSLDTRLEVDVELTEDWNSTLFPTLDAASAFYRESPVGWSPVMGNEKQVEGLKLSTDQWAVKAGKMNKLKSSFFDEIGSSNAKFDHVLVMQDVPVTWSKP